MMRSTMVALWKDELLIDRGWYCLLEIIHNFAPMMLSEIFMFLHDSQAGRATSQRATPRPHARHQMLLAALGL